MSAVRCSTCAIVINSDNDPECFTLEGAGPVLCVDCRDATEREPRKMRRPTMSRSDPGISHYPPSDPDTALGIARDQLKRSLDDFIAKPTIGYQSRVADAMNAYRDSFILAK